MIVGIIGSGGREHSICEVLSKSKKVDQIYWFPGNAGTAQIAKNISMDFDKFENLKNYILKKKLI